MRSGHAFLFAMLIVGCSGKVNSGDDASTPSSDSGTADTPTTGLSGTYKGYIESYKFPDGSDSVVMNLSVGGDGTVSGTVVFGDAAMLAPPTDPNVGYPPGFDGSMGTARGPAEGFAYTISSGVLSGSRLTLQVETREVWKSWCELQTTIYPQYNGGSDGSCGELIGYGCLPNVASSAGTTCSWSSCDHTTDTPIDCGKLALCRIPSVCTCTASACTVVVGPKGDVAFDMQLSAPTLNGSTTGISPAAPLNVHLTRE